MRINDRFIGNNSPCFIIAEAGINHNGDIEIAKKMIDAAKNAGADAVKFQTFKAENVASKYAEIAEYQREDMRHGEKQLDMIKKFELNYEDFKILKDYCDVKEIMFLSTPHSLDAIDFLESLIPIYKIGSGDLTNIPFLRKIAGKRKPIILSTGMANLGEIEEAIWAVEEEGNRDILLLHCISNYPTKIEDVNLRVIQTLNEAFKFPVGLSDHTLSTVIPAVAVALGACIIEKHFTLDKAMEGPDHKSSLEPEELKEMIKNIKEVEKALGNGIKKPTKEEEKIKKIVRKSIVAKVDIPKGSTIEEKMIEIKRPGNGISPKHIDKIIGSRVRVDIHKDEIIKWDEIEF